MLRTLLYFMICHFLSVFFFQCTISHFQAACGCRNENLLDLLFLCVLLKLISSYFRDTCYWFQQSIRPMNDYQVTSTSKEPDILNYPFQTIFVPTAVKKPKKAFFLNRYVCKQIKNKRVSRTTRPLETFVKTKLLSLEHSRTTGLVV